MTDDADVEDWQRWRTKISEELYIHLGFYKTGTSYLQKYIFPQFKNLDYANLKYSPNEIYNKIVHGTFEVENKTLVSVNALSGMPFSKNRQMDKYDILLRIKGYYPEAKIIIVNREPLTWIKSCYNEYIKSGGLRSFKYWLYNIFDWDYIDGNYIRNVKSLFHNVKIMSYETLKKDDEKFVSDFQKYLKTNEPLVVPNIIINKGYKNYQLQIIKLFNVLGLLFPKLTGRNNLYRRIKGR